MAVREVSLLAITGPLAGTRWSLAGETRIGRAAGNDMVLGDAHASREHAVIRPHNLGWMIRDLGSSHGTLLNGERLTAERALFRNDEIQIGGSRFLFDSDFDLQNAAFSDQSVFLASPTEETMAVPPVATLSGKTSDEDSDIGKDSLDLVVQIGELFDSPNVPFAESLEHAGARIGRIFKADGLALFLRDSSKGGEMRSVVALAGGKGVFVDRSIVQRVAREKRSLLISDRPEFPPHPAPGSPPSPAVRSVLCAPLESADSLLGVLYFQRQELDAYSLLDLRRARALARLLAAYVETRQQAEALERRLRFALPDSGLVGDSEAMRGVRHFIREVGPTPATVLLLGETGTGKEAVAREIHRASGRRGPFVAINCAAVPENLFESELFGHERGAFTGADRQRRGRVEEAKGGTLFLDEVGELPLALQAKLLRLIQERTFERIGGNDPLRADVRVLSATNRDLMGEVAAGAFREDLYYRLAVVPLTLPPLRDRGRGDIEQLADHFLARHAESLGRAVPRVAPETLGALGAHSWPGNIRELSNCLERALLLNSGAPVLLPRHLGLEVESDGTPRPRASGGEDPSRVALRPMADVERDHILRVLDACGGNQIKAADILGIHRNTLRKKLADYREG